VLAIASNDVTEERVDDETYAGAMSQAMRPSGTQSPQAARVLDAALTCLARVGLAKTTLDDVAREAGCARATVYRCFPSKTQLLVALVEREADRLQRAVLTASALSETLSDSIAAVVTTAATFLREHAALGFLAAHEPDVLLPFLAFEHEDAVLHTAAELVAPAFDRFLARDSALRLGEWVTRLTMSHLCSPSEHVDIEDAAHVRALVDDFVVPGFVNSEGVSR
jgi:AcrR family transcriptional regulator